VTTDKLKHSVRSSSEFCDVFPSLFLLAEVLYFRLLKPQASSLKPQTIHLSWILKRRHYLAGITDEMWRNETMSLSKLRPAAAVPVSCWYCDITLRHMYRLICYNTDCRSQWPRGLKHELYSLVRKLGSWVRIPLKAWISVFVLSCVHVARRSPTVCVKNIMKLKKMQGPTKGCRAMMNK
jgi:hypothetical protein